MNKKCVECGDVKPIEEFYIDKTLLCGRESKCKQCRRDQMNRKYRELNPVIGGTKKHKNYEKRRIYLRKKSLRYRSTIKGTINSRMGSALRSALRGNKSGRGWESLVDYTVNDLIKHIERNFKPGMSWENRGSWHIDHIIPISAFNFTGGKDIDFKKCWALKNLQPLWAMENSYKTDRLIKPFQPSLILAGGL